MGERQRGFGLARNDMGQVVLCEGDGFVVERKFYDMSGPCPCEIERLERPELMAVTMGCFICIGSTPVYSHSSADLAD